MTNTLFTFKNKKKFPESNIFSLEKRKLLYAGF